MTPAAGKMIAALALCPCCKISRQRVCDRESELPEGKIARIDFPCGADVLVDADGVAICGDGCPYPLDDALFEIQKRIAEEVRP